MLAENAYACENLDEIWFIPSADPPHKKEENVLNYEFRSQMTELAIRNIPYFVKYDFEAQRKAYSYTAETLRLLQQLYPDNEFYFIMGADSLFQIETWHEPAVIMADCVILAAMRNHTPDDVFKKQMDYLEAKYHADIRFLNIPDLALSSSEIRHRVREHQSIRFMVPEGVREYIEEHQLYCR